MDRQQASETLLQLLALADQPSMSHVSALGEAEWRTIVELAAEHGVMSLLWRGLQQLPDRVTPPDSIMQMLALTHDCVAMNNRGHYRRLRRILTQLKAASVPAIVLKGAYLVEAVYRDPGLRPMTDLDILIPHEDLPVAEQAMLAMGYLPDDLNESQATTHFHIAYHDPSVDGRVEIHWGLQRPEMPFHIAPADLWQSAVRVTLAGTETQALSPEDLLLHLCFHAGYSHLFYVGLRSIYDIATVLRHFGDDLRWPLVVERAHRWGIGNIVSLTLSVTEALTGAATPAGVQDDLAPRLPDQRLLQWATQRVLERHDDARLVHAFDPTAPHSGFAELAMADRPTDHWRTIWRACFPPRAALAQKYHLAENAPWLATYYPLHLARLFVRQTGRLWRLLRRDPETIQWAAEQAAQKRQSALETWMLGS